jgi:hypothetical protein
MFSFRKLLLSLLSAAGLTLATLSASASPIVFNFDSDTTGMPNPSDTVGGLTLSIFGAGTVCDVSEFGFASIGGNALITNFCGETFGATILTFSSLLSSLTFDYAVSDTDPVGFLYLLDGNFVGAGSLAFTPGDPPSFEGSQTITGPFNEVLFDTGSSESDYALDNLSAVVATPEPSSITLLGTGILGFAGLVRRRLKG